MRIVTHARTHVIRNKKRERLLGDRLHVTESGFKRLPQTKMCV
jgi:hypothetical protein